MRRIRILLADNDPEFLRTREEILEAQGYDVIPASGYEEAERLLQSTPIDLAIVDLRLRDDTDEADLSGLALIKRVAPEVPKILLTAFPSYDIARKALKQIFDEVPFAVDFVAKQEGVDTLLQRVALVIEKYVLQEEKKRRQRRIALMVILGLLVIGGLTILLWEYGLKGVLIAVLTAITLEAIAALVLKFTGVEK